MPEFKSRLPLPDGHVGIVPSVLSADMACLGRDVGAVSKADWIQVDVMDGHFVPNISYGPGLVKTLRGITKLPLDAHLMIDNPADFILPFAKAGADLITFHLEAAEHPEKTIRQIKALGLSAGLAIKPQTPVSAAEPFMKHLDLFLVMTVNPGFGGQAFMTECLGKVAQARELISRSGKQIWLQVDGGIGPDTAPAAALAGADSLVAGNAIFGNKNPSQAVQKMRELCA